ETTPPVVAFDGTPEVVAGHLSGTWQYFRVDVPENADLLGWDVRLSNVSAGDPQLYVAREALPQSGRAGVSPSASGWNTGRQWDAGTNVFGVSTGERFIASTGRPLEPGTYFIGVLAGGGVDNAYTIENRAIGIKDSGLGLEALADVAFDGGTQGFTDLPRGEPAYFKLTVPAGKPTWQIKLAVDPGDEMRFAVLKDVLPNSEAAIGQSGSYPANEGLIVAKTGEEIYQLIPSGANSTIPEGDYWFAVIAETTTASGTFESVGEMPVTNIGVAADLATVTPVSLEGGEIKFYRFTVPANSAGFEVRLENRTGGAGFSIGEGNALPYPYSSAGSDGYGFDGGRSSIATGTGIYSRVLNFNPTPLTYTVTMRAAASGGGYPPATADLEFRTLPVVDLGFEGSVSVTDQENGTWAYFKVTVPNDADLLGWDVWLRNVSGGDPLLEVRRDLLPTPAGAGNNSSLPANDAWPSGSAWPVGGDWTARGNDGIRSVSSHRMMASSGRPLEPGTYYIAVFASGTTSYDVVGRGIGVENSAFEVDLAGTVSFNGGALALTGLEPRDPAYLKVTVPANQPSWRVRLSPTSGEVMMGVALGALPNTSVDGFYTAGLDNAGVRVTKAGTELFHLLPEYGESSIPAGDYYFAVVGEGTSPSGNTIGTGNAAATFRSLGPIPVTDLGTAALVPTTEGVTLEGGEIKVYQFAVPAGAPAIEVRLRNRSGNPGFTLRYGTEIPGPYQGGSVEDYGFEGGKGALGSSGALITIPNPASGTAMARRAGP
ncbi:MAG: hypothetical protein ACC661_08770, partial [Verrucomicrobiales bacterium]